MKPTYGRVSRYGIVAFASSLDQIGPFARDTRDAATLLHTVAGRDERDATSAPVPVPDELLHLAASDDEAAGALRGRRLGLPREYFIAGMEPDLERRIREAVAALEAAGATVDEVSLPHTDYGLATTIWTQDIACANRMATRIEVGLCWINSWFLRDLRTSFGGAKHSGIGREGGVHSLDFYTELRNVMVKL
jgi:Asp-tRNA(Asn)/Glu-tRNA(Gln) amidotransferase A subunit family amidase